MVGLARSERLAAAALVTVLWASPAYSLTPDEIFKLRGSERQKVLEEGAKKEGAIAWYTTSAPEALARPMKEAFEKKYPYIEVSFVTTTSSHFLQRATAEMKSGNVTMDVAAAGIVDGVRGSGLMQKFWTPAMEVFPKGYYDDQYEWIAYWRSWNGIAWNTQLADEADMPTTWEGIADLSVEKYKGKIVWPASPTAGGPRMITHLRAIWGDEKTEAFLKKLVPLDIRATLGASTVALDQTSVGEYAITLMPALHNVGEKIIQGSPIKGRNLAPAMTRTSAIGIMKNAPHPHAAQLYLDFIVSEEGQKIMSELLYYPAYPKVKPVEGMLFGVPELHNIEAFDLDPNKNTAMTAKSNDMFKKYFAANK